MAVAVVQLKDGSSFDHGDDAETERSGWIQELFWR